jgi:hypothetical protein
MPRLSAPLLALVGAAVCAALLGGGQTARAQFFSTSAGPLAQAHADLDNKDKCEKCHAEPRKVTREKCVACHAPIADRQREGKGVHANQKALGKPCELCHNEHKGRGKDILGWSTFGGKDHFDHDALTTFALAGKHKDVACAKCHTQKTSTGYLTYLKAPTACVGCHANPHGETREPMKKCERCHDARSWKMLEHAAFNHDKDSRYPIERKHEAAKCTACHAKAGKNPPSAKASGPIPTGTDGLAKLTFRYPAWAFDCTPCHENVHGTSLFGTKACKLCHSAKVEWPKVNFDHNKRTKFPLEGAHEHKATCESCHKKDEKHAPERACIACHPDKHNGRFAAFKGPGTNGQADCNTCHTANVWKPENKFDHAKNTRFPLTAAHAGADCRACHRGKGPTEWEHLENLITKMPGGKGLAVACMGCHQHENVHQKQYKNEDCLGCHFPGQLPRKGKMLANPQVSEAHAPNGKFPLTEGHKNVDCTKCHPGNKFENFKGAPPQCGPTCHPDELHKGSLGDKCMTCHKGGKWEARNFDHDRDTKWPLVGNHKDVLCDSCHPRRDFAANRGKSRTCYNCHKKDDAHSGELGTHCENCHIPDGTVIFEHNDPKMSDWPLNGKHYSVECNKCHTSIRFRPTPRECNGCHGEPTVHKGQLGTLCARCHEEQGWKTIHTRHDVPGIRFAGAHDRVSCYKCHTLGRLLEGTGPLCITCHRNDDIHNNGLGPRCGECHTQLTWAGAHFDHNTVGCNLTGIHRLVPCALCHTGGNFVALSPTCGSCHRKDAIRGAKDPSSGGAAHAAYQNCIACHNVNFFNPSKPGRGRESVCQ